MLKDGKISVEEAEALLGVLDEADDTGTGFETSPKSSESGTGDERKVRAFVVNDEHDERKQGGSHGDRHSDQRKDGGRSSGGRSGSFNLDIDLGGIRDTVREAMKGVSEAVKGVVGELSDLDLGNEIFRAMGKVRAEVEDEVTQKVGEATTLQIHNKWGDIRVTGTETDDITVRAEGVAWGGSQDEANGVIDDLGLRLERRDAAWVVVTGLENRTHGRVRLDFEISLPRRMGVDVATASGDIWIEDLEGRQSIKTLSGDVTVADIGSGIGSEQVIKTKSGDVVGGALSGTITLSSASGDVEINGYTGELAVTTQSGDITIRDGNGPVHLRTLSGDVNAELNETGDNEIEASSVSGDIELRFPQDAALDVEAKTTSGDISVNRPLEAEERSERRVAGRINGGGQALTISTVSGDITVA